MLTPPYSIDAYLGILLGRAAIEKYSVVITPKQSKKILKEKLPDCCLEIKGNPECIGVVDYFSYKNNMHLRVLTFYYLKDNREKFQQWLRKKLPVEELPRLKSVKPQMYKTLIDDYNCMASDNFKTALALFRDGYHKNRVVIFGEQNSYNDFQVGGVSFRVIPAAKTTDKVSSNDFNNGIGNTACHINGMAIMLACKWITDRNPAGKILLKKLKLNIPNFKISAPSIPPIRIADLRVDSPMVKAEADQWDWRMETKN
jgi:hypothetical protein